MTQGMASQKISRLTGAASSLVLKLALLVVLVLAATPNALADPDYGDGPILYGFDPVLKATDDPRLLGVDRLVLLRRLEILGVDPLRHPDRRPGLEASFFKVMNEKSRVDLVRMEHLVEYNGPLGVMTEFQYPSFFYLFPSSEALPGGFTYYPARPVHDPVVRIFLDDLSTGAARRHAVDQVMTRNESLDVAGAGKTGKDGDGLINLTIPIKLPRTLEKIIGRGEKTKIKITGRERIAITGESTVVNPFVPNERVTSQSLFPTLDMEQELQVNLSGTIGEKIIIEVDHNSAQIGPDATKIKLMYQGDEDEIIKTIETGDVGLTLPGSQLLGYNSNKSGLFGVKVTGQMGRADFTVVASKQKAESSSKSFNAKGGVVTDHEIFSSNYINNRFFKLDIPADEVGGRRNGEKILLSSIKIFKLMGPGQFGADDVANVAAYIDRTGFRNWNDATIGFSDPREYGQRWRLIENFDTLVNTDGGLEAIDLRSTQLNEDVLAVVYTVVDANDAFVAQVGDDPSQVSASQTLNGQGTDLYYRMKMLKSPVADPDDHLYGYVLRNIYSLGGANIDASTFDLRIEAIDFEDLTPDLNEENLPYVRIFGLDIENPSRTPGADGLVDVHNPLIFDLNKGLLKFPLDFPEPFNATEAQYAANADDPGFSFETSPFLAANLADEFIYNPAESPSNFDKEQYFKIVSTHASASSSFNLGASNIEVGSEVVTLDGRTLVNGVDYEIDYLFGELTLKGDAANLTPDSKIGVTYSFSPFFGGGNTSLMGLNVGYDLGRESKLATTWLYQSEAIVGEKAKLGEEPSKNLVGNLNVQHTMRPYFLTHVANFLSRHNTERESSIQFSGEMALSLPNPNTKGRVFLEDFEGVDASDVISLSRIAWSWASPPYLGEEVIDNRTFEAVDRVENVRWFLPKERSLRRHLNPDLVNQERDETQPTMDMFLRSDTGWQGESWGGIMRGISRTGLDLSKSQFIEIWVNDRQPEISQRRGKLHIDFGYISEDGFWPVNSDATLDTLTYQKEDVNSDGVWVFDEDTGLDGLDSDGPQRFEADFDVDGDSPYPFINGTARNNREDDEDLNGNTRLDVDNGYFTTTIDLATTEALVDVVYDYDDVSDLVAENISWRKYRIPIAAVDEVSRGTLANIKAITHARIWYEDDQALAPNEVHLQLSEFRFLGSRWEREGVRRIDGEVLLTSGERLPGEEFFLGEVNNKENPDYRPPFTVEEINSIPEKEQSLVLNFQNIELGHMVRASKQVSSQGDDYTTYQDISWYWNNTNHANADLDLFFRAGADTLNYYEVNYRFADSANKTGWHQMNLNIAELSNAKNGTLDENGHVLDTITDVRSGDVYDVRVVGRPDLRRVKRYYFGVANNALADAASGVIYLNDVKLEGVKRDMGLAQRAGVRVNMADVIKADFDWKRTDAEYHGLDKSTGSGVNFEDWTFNSSINLDDFVPLAGFKVPVNVSRRQTIQRPKYETNSDIEILDEDVRNQESTVDTSERFSSRLSHSPSKAALLRYMIDPWVLSVNGSRGNKTSPIDRAQNKSLAGAVNYDLRINGNYKLGKFPGLSYIPVVKGLTFLPKKLAFGGSFTSSERRAVSIAADGVETPRQSTKTRPSSFTASIDYQPMSVLDMSVSGKSDRDMLRESEKFGVNIGQENKRAYDLRMTITPPKARELPEGKIFAPVRAAAKGLIKLRPSVQFTGSFDDVHDPGIRQPGDPTNIRSVSNRGKWDFRVDVPIGDAFKSVFPENKYSQAQRDQMVSQQAAREQQDARRGSRGGSPDATPQPGAETPPDVLEDEGLTPEERQQRVYERQLQEAEAQQEQDLADGRVAEEAKPTVDSNGRISPMVLFNPFLNVLRNTTPVKITYTTSTASSYGRLTDTAHFWYKTGLISDLDVDEDQYSVFAADDRVNLAMSTTSKISRSLGLDVKYATSHSLRNQIGSITENYKQDWPDGQISLSGLEKWGVFGAKPDDLESGWFRSSNLNFSYKRSKTVNNYTAVSNNPKVITTIAPRWTMNFQSGFTATLNATLTNDNSISNGVTTSANKSRLGLQLRHQFRADSFLVKLGLYRPGASQSVNMDVDMSFQTDRTERLNPTGFQTAPTGNTRFNVNPRFSVQVTRNLNAAVRFIYSRAKNIASNQTTTSLGMGLEATFVF
ncbi:MAG: cell surface protein SprA [Candidatus Krumholzibacteria bacterium]|nr:cell surface protein SprA [Candidatus Krumholzibacteria bacterium]